MENGKYLAVIVAGETHKNNLLFDHDEHKMPRPFNLGLLVSGIMTPVIIKEIGQELKFFPSPHMPSH